jgi:hypothetical protein
LWNRHKLEWGSNIGDDAGDAINYTFVAIGAAFTGAQFIVALSEVPLIANNAENIVDVAGAFYEAVSTCDPCTAEEVAANTLTNFGRNKIEDGLVGKVTGAIASLYRKIPESQRKVLIDFLKQVKNKGTTKFDNVVSGTKERLRIFFKGKRSIDLIIEQIIKKNNFPKNVAEQFRRDCNKVPDLLNKFVDNEDAVKAWEFAFEGALIRTNVNVLESISTALQRGIKEIPDVVSHANHPNIIITYTVEHIFRGHGTNGGRHHISALIADNSRKLTNRLKETADGFYEAVIKRSDGTTSTKSFWPDTWDEDKVMDELKHVMANNPINITGNTWEGFTTTGQKINYYVKASDNSIISAFPVLD